MVSVLHNRLLTSASLSFSDDDVICYTTHVLSLKRYANTDDGLDFNAVVLYHVSVARHVLTCSRCSQLALAETSERFRYNFVLRMYTNGSVLWLIAI